MYCPGFQLETGSKVTPGAVIAHGSGSKVTIKVFKEKSSGNWWVYYGLNDDTPTAVGYYPANLFAGLAQKADEIAIGGEARTRRSIPTPPMGNGHLPSEQAASVSNLQFVDQEGQSTPVTTDLPITAWTPKCYYVSPIVGSKFSYGGPAGCFE
ncbi:hypothetical protein QOZ80_6AG0510510 [Eleusine coracana subsp. coracana]|nr:hypothetical protein QOZ80_6AG0510510 [Eleusine coracana subsp. coracana]